MIWNVSIYGGNNMCKWNYYARLVRNWDEGLGAKYYRLSQLRVILCSLSEQYYGAHTALQMAKLPREPIYGAARELAWQINKTRD